MLSVSLEKGWVVKIIPHESLIPSKNNSLKQKFGSSVHWGNFLSYLLMLL